MTVIAGDTRTAIVGEEGDKLKSFESGIDDYITKPFSPRELVARIKAVLRRHGTPEDDLLEAAGIRMNLRSHQVTIMDKTVHLGPTEFRLLQVLMRHPERAFDAA